jgi:hypothetical protein
MNKIKLGDTISYRGAFGSGPLKSATVEYLKLTQYPREKYGEDVEEVNIDDVKANKVVFGLSDGYWCYSDQVKA